MTGERDRERERERGEYSVLLVFRKSRRFNRIGLSSRRAEASEAAAAVAASSYVDTIKRGSKEGRGRSGGARD